MNEILHALFSTEGFVLGTLVPFLFVLTVVVFVHEMGHYLVGRWCGIGVKAFSIGFGPELIGFNDRHGTRWKLCAIPLGGYVKFVGDMNVTSSQPDAEDSRDADRGGAQGRLPHAADLEARGDGGCRPAVQFPADHRRLRRAVFHLWPLCRGADGGRSYRRTARRQKAGILPGDRFVSVDGTQGRDLRRRPAPGFGPRRRRHHLRHAARRQGSHRDGDAGADGAGGRARQQGQGRRDRRRQQQGARPAPAGHLQPGRRRDGGGRGDRPYHRAHRPVPEALRRRARRQVPAGRPGQDRRHGRQGGETGFRVAGAARRAAVGRNRNSQSFADSRRSTAAISCSTAWRPSSGVRCRNG